MIELLLYAFQKEIGEMSSVVVDLDELRQMFEQTGDLYFGVSYDREMGDNGGLLISLTSTEEIPNKTNFYDIKAPSEDGYLVIVKDGQEYKYLFGDILREAEERGVGSDIVLGEIVNSIDEGSTPKERLLSWIEEESFLRDKIERYEQAEKPINQGVLDAMGRSIQGVRSSMIEYLQSKGVSYDVAIEVANYIMQEEANGKSPTINEQDRLNELKAAIESHSEGDGYDKRSLYLSVKAIESLIKDMNGTGYEQTEIYSELTEAQQELGDLRNDLYANPAVQARKNTR